MGKKKQRFVLCNIRFLCFNVGGRICRYADIQIDGWLCTQVTRNLRLLTNSAQASENTLWRLGKMAGGL